MGWYTLIETMVKGGCCHECTDHSAGGRRPGHPGWRTHFAGGGGIPYPGGGKRGQGPGGIWPGGGPGDPGCDDAGYVGAAGVRGAAQELHRAHPVFDGQVPGVGQTAGADGGRGRLSAQALLLCGAERPGQGAAAPVLRLPGQGPGRGAGGRTDAVHRRGTSGAGLQPGVGGRPGGQPDRHRIQDPAAADAEPPADLPGAGGSYGTSACSARRSRPWRGAIWTTR